MKKSYLMIAAAAAIFAACSKTDTFKEVDTQDVPINFSQSATEKVTRAETDMTWFHTENNAFGVYGFKGTNKIFKNEEVKCSNATAPYAWSHATIRFWDKAVSNYNFYAYAPFTGTTNSETGANPTFDETKGFIFTGLSLIANVNQTQGVSPDKVVATAVEGVGYTSNKLHNDGSYTDANGAHSVTDHSNAPTVPFVFSHILSKLSFQVTTDIEATVATFTVTSIKIDFPQDNNVTWTETAKAAPAGTTTYSNSYAAKNGEYETTVFPASASGSPTTQPVTYNVKTDLGNVYIVTPVNTDKTKHEFGVEVTYNITYADNTSETGCVATGVIGTGTPATNTYTPSQNQYYKAVIKIAPAEIQFCVEGVDGWTDPATEVTQEVK